MTVEQILIQNWAVIMLAAFGAGVALELLAIGLLRRKGAVPLKDSLLSIFLGLASDPVNALFAFITSAALFGVAPYAFFDIPNTWWALLLCFVLDDFRFYMHHRICHRVRWGWAMHAVHHSSTNFNMPIALRQSWMKHFTGTMMLKVPLILIGFDPVLVIFCGVLNATYQFFLHTQTIGRMPRWFEYIFNTPSHHRVHHGRNAKYLDANYAGTLIIWDRILGTFVEEDRAEPVDFGLVKNLDTYNPVTILTHEYVAIAKDASQRGLSWWQRFCYIFAPPGWSHDGSRLSSEDMKRAAGLLPPVQPRGTSQEV
ncbi:MAG: sterol desaturase family protein [Erythrobacteraceae bacterium]|jgi:sterol desaturase/sphingolipid hydroxylase (fatty acid hydroxylase superfamily)|nr:sterol desaturase family protein [Erythrobacteraceae bacterium]